MENSLPLGTDNVHGQILEHIFAESSRKTVSLCISAKWRPLCLFSFKYFRNTHNFKTG